MSFPHDRPSQGMTLKYDSKFECHLSAPVCGRKFSTPKTRRLHLIQAHNYPKQYFFAVTNKGIGGLLKKWGEGASLIRKDWKSREDGSIKMDEDNEDDEDDNSVGVKDVESTTTDDDEEPADIEATPRIGPRRMLSPTTSQGSSFRSSDSHNKQKSNNLRSNPQKTTGNEDVAGLTQSLNALSLVPNSVRFGRGGKTSGFASGDYRKGNNDNLHDSAGSRPPPMEVDRGVPSRGRVMRGGRSFKVRGRGF